VRELLNDVGAASSESDDTDLKRAQKPRGIGAQEVLTAVTRISVHDDTSQY
jgi:hypothetical protein